MPRIQLDLPEKFRFATEISVRITDINYGGHLGNDAVLSLLHEARVRFFRQHGYTEKDVEGVGIIMTDAAIVYRSESFYGDALLVQVDVTDLQSRTCDIVYRVTNRESGREVVRAKTGIAFFDYRARRLVEAPSGFREKCEPLQGDAPRPVNRPHHQ